MLLIVNVVHYESKIILHIGTYQNINASQNMEFTLALVLKYFVVNAIG